MKKLLILIMVLLFTGCSNPIKDATEVIKARKNRRHIRTGLSTWIKPHIKFLVYKNHKYDSTKEYIFFYGDILELSKSTNSKVKLFAKELQCYFWR